MDLSVVAVIVQLIFLEGILSIDNAAVLGAMVSHLPNDVPIAWPPKLTHFGQRLHPALGNQRTAALRVGLLGAYLGRGLMLIMASFVIQNPWLKVLGALYLLRLAFDNLGRAEPGEADAHTHPTEVKSFWAVVLTVELADLAFSIDNVVAAVGVSDNLWAVLLGVFIGILLMRFAAGWFSYLVLREPVLKTTVLTPFPSPPYLCFLAATSCATFCVLVCVAFCVSRVVLVPAPRVVRACPALVGLRRSPFGGGRAVSGPLSVSPRPSRSGVAPPRNLHSGVDDRYCNCSPVNSPE